MGRQRQCRGSNGAHTQPIVDFSGFVGWVSDPREASVRAKGLKGSKGLKSVKGLKNEKSAKGLKGEKPEKSEMGLKSGKGVKGLKRTKNEQGVAAVSARCAGPMRRERLVLK